MSNVLVSAPKKSVRITLGELHQELVRLRERVEYLEDLRELNEAMARNRGKKMIPWADAKRSSVWKIDRRGAEGFLVTAYQTDAMKEGETIWHK